MKSLWIYLFSFSFLFAEEFPLVFTEHVLFPEEKPFSYTAVTGSLPVLIDKNSNDPPSEIFFTAYLNFEQQRRPITFVFPGGPGASCAIETLCSFGPKRLLTLAEGKKNLPPYELIDNPQTLLPWTDLVFVDPPGTGFSTLDISTMPSNLFSVEGDFAILGEFVRAFTALFKCWNSPKFLLGTSYGSSRSCGVANYLLQHDLSLHGLMLMGTAIDFSTLIGQHNRILPDSFLVPTFAATAWYHNRFGNGWELEEVIDYAKRFCYEEYIPTLLQPHNMSELETRTFYERLSKLIGLPYDTVRRYQGRFDENLYVKEFFGPERKVLGGLDTRYIGNLGIRTDDPSYREIQGIYCTYNQYLANELDTNNPFITHIPFSQDSSENWNYNTRDSIEFPELMQRLQQTILYNPEMQVFVGSGYYDCRTPFAATEYCFEHLDLPTQYDKNLHFSYYKAGHGFIFDLPSLQKVHKDLVLFFEKTTKN